VRKPNLLIVGVVVILAVLVGLLVDAAVGRPSIQAQAQGFDDESPWPEAEGAVRAGSLSALDLSGTRPIYFVPQDSNGTATVLVIYNTTSLTQTVAIQSFSSTGSTLISTTVEVGPNRLRRAIADSLVTDPPPSWADSLLVNFADFSLYAVMHVPQGIKFDGYVVFNGATGTIDPRIDQGALPLRFSTDPATVFLPSIQSD
jgi:hypothetical protein